MITIVIISFYSDKKIKDRISEIDKKYKIIIIENSRNIDLKKEIELKYSNVKVIIPDQNLGWGKAANQGIKLARTDYVFLTQPDVKLIKNCVNKLEKLISKVRNEFSVITPIDVGNKIFKNYDILSKKQSLLYEDSDIKEVDFVDLTWLINKKKIPNYFWDEKIFLYFEAHDFSKRIRENKGKVFIAKKIFTSHIGSASHEKQFETFSRLNRNWHYNWSRFYFFRKHFGYFFAIKKIFPIFIKLFCKLFLSILSLNNLQDIKLIYKELEGLICSMLGFSSFYRPYKENILKKII